MAFTKWIKRGPSDLQLIMSLADRSEHNVKMVEFTISDFPSDSQQPEAEVKEKVTVKITGMQERLPHDWYIAGVSGKDDFVFASYCPLDRSGWIQIGKSSNPELGRCDNGWYYPIPGRVKPESVPE